MVDAPRHPNEPSPGGSAAPDPTATSPPGAGSEVRPELAESGLEMSEAERRRRREGLAQLLPAIAEALDIRTVFPRLSTLAQAVVPHDTVSFALLTADRTGVRVQIASNYDVRDFPEYRFTASEERIEERWWSFVAHDCTVLEPGVVRVRVSSAEAPLEEIELRPGPMWTSILAEYRLRSLLRVPLRIKGETIGAVSFGISKPDAYGEEDVELASRIADHISLAIAYERLADEAVRVAQAREREERLEDRVAVLSRQLESLTPPRRAIGVAPAWRRALGLATRVAATDTTVLLTGESGTGKEVLARHIHAGSPRASGPFVAVNCAALPEHLLESELFGHERGAFTGAHVARPGRIEQAAGGVLFLDEVGEMAPAMQAKFLRVLQEREYQRIGGSRSLRADVRVVAATNRDPREAMRRGLLREDLYYRLASFEIQLPPLRERREDVALLAEAFVAEIAASFGRPAAGLSEDARDLLLAHEWPGNVRELRNAIERAMILCDGGLITGEHLPIDPSRTATSRSSNPVGVPAAFPPGGISLEAIERDLVEGAMTAARQNKSLAAALLGIPRGQLYSLLRRHRPREPKGH